MAGLVLMARREERRQAVAGRRFDAPHPEGSLS